MSVMFEYIASNYLTRFERNILQIPGADIFYLKLKTKFDPTFVARCYLLFRHKWFLYSNVFEGELYRTEKKNLRFRKLLRKQMRLLTGGIRGENQYAVSDFEYYLLQKLNNELNSRQKSRISNQLGTFDIYFCSCPEEMRSVRKSLTKKNVSILKLDIQWLVSTLSHLAQIATHIEVMRFQTDRNTASAYFCFRYSALLYKSFGKLSNIEKSLKQLLEEGYHNSRGNNLFFRALDGNSRITGATISRIERGLPTEISDVATRDERRYSRTSDKVLMFKWEIEEQLKEAIWVIQYLQEFNISKK